MGLFYTASEAVAFRSDRNFPKIMPIMASQARGRREMASRRLVNIVTEMNLDIRGAAGIFLR